MSGEGYPSPGVLYHGRKVFSCFAGAGGSTMGYKLAGFDVVGCCEIDKFMSSVYKANHHPRYFFRKDIRRLNKVKLPDELYDLDVLDGSPPCSTFSMAGNREKDWGKERKFMEGQANQTLDDLYFHFLDLANRLRPKVIVSENVTGIMMGAARSYVSMILLRCQEIGYVPIHMVLEGERMGLPQRRHRFFMVALRKDLINHVSTMTTLDDQTIPVLKMQFDERRILLKEVLDDTDTSIDGNRKKMRAYWKLTRPGDTFATITPRGNCFNVYRHAPNKVMPTLTASHASHWHPSIFRKLNQLEMSLISSFPLDFDFKESKPRKMCYVMGMSVPPTMMAAVADAINLQWLDPIHKALGTSRRMSKVRSTNTSPEMRLRMLLRRAGIKFKKNDKGLPGSPDAALHGRKVAIFVDGCFWHGCPRHYRQPASNIGFWQRKLETNKARDDRVDSELSKMGWHVVRIWECEMVKMDENELTALLKGRKGRR